MKHYGKRVFVLLLVLALSVGMIGCTQAEEAETAGSFDDPQDIFDGQSGDAVETTLQGGLYNVTDLTVDGLTAIVAYQAPENATLIVSIHDETTGQTLATGAAEVDSTSEAATVPIMGDMPEYFVASAFLYDRDTDEPLSATYRTEMYTAKMQTLLRQTVDDFDPYLVLNLDEDRTTNFGVYHEDTIQVKDHNAVVTDNGDRTYTVSNGGETFTSLKSGDKLSYTDAEGTLWLIKVQSVTKNRNGTLTIAEDPGATLEDFFDTLKIEVTEQDAEVILEGYEAPDGTAENVSARGGTGVSLLAAGLETDEKAEKKYTLEFSTDKEKAIVVSGSVELTISIKYYYSADLDVDTTEIKVTPKVSFGVKSNEKGGAATTDYMIYRDMSLADWMQFDFFGGILTVGLEPKLELKVEGKVEATLSYSGTIGVKRSGSEKPQSLSTAPSAKFECKDEATIYAGISLSPYVDIVDKKVMRISLKGALGVETKATMSKEFDKTEKTSIHDCELCLDGKVTTKGDVTVELKLLDGVGTSSYSLLKVEKEYARFYYSIDHSEFGSGRCPHIQYLIDLLVLNEKGDPLPGAQIAGLGSSVLTTDLNGQAQAFAYRGEYTLTATSSNEKHTGTKTVTVKDEPVSVTITARSSAKAVTVTVTDQKHKPLSGMTISGTGLDIAPVTDKDGVAEFELDNGNYVLTASDGVFSGAGSLSVRGSATRLTIIASDEPQDVTVTAVTADGTRVPNLTIGGTGITPAPVTDENGQATFRLPWGGYDLTASGGAYSGKASVIVGDKPVNAGIIVQFFDYPVTVTVVDKDGKGLSGLTIGGTGLASAPITGADGSVSFRLSAGTYQLTVTNGTGSAEKTLTVTDGPASATLVLKEEPGDLNWAFDEKTGHLTIWGTGSIPREFTTNSFPSHDRVKTMEIMEGITGIGDHVFYQFFYLQSVVLPDGLTTIGDCAFQQCKNLTSIDLPDGLTTIGHNAFSECRSLSGIDLPNGLTNIGNSVFTYCDSLSSVSFPDELTSIDDYAFDGCSSLSDIDLPDGLTSIGVDAFHGCSSLISIDLPDGLTSIGRSAFSGCTNLSSIVLPDGLASIGDYTFDGCKNLSAVRFLGDAPAIGNAIFSGVTANIYYPAGNATWTADKLQNYGGRIGNITWIPY